MLYTQDETGTLTSQLKRQHRTSEKSLLLKVLVLSMHIIFIFTLSMILYKYGTIEYSVWLHYISVCWLTFTPARTKRKQPFQGRGKWFPWASDQPSHHSCFGGGPSLPAWPSKKHAVSTGRPGPSASLSGLSGCQ